MKTGKTIGELAQEIERQAAARRDFLAPSRRLTMDGVIQPPMLSMPTNGHMERFAINDLAHEQIGSRLNIPKRYYDLMLAEAPELLSANVNHWLHGSEDRRMVRTLDGRVRAFLSDRYRPLDNLGVAEAVLPVLGEAAGLRIASCEITERRLYIQAVNERVQGEVKKGDAVQAGVCISNSEVGCGALIVSPLIFRLVCENGMIREDSQMRKYHAGRAHGGDGLEVLAWDKLSDEARAASDKAIWLQVRDLTRAALDEALFTRGLDDLRRAAGEQITREPEDVVELTSKRFNLAESEGKGILRHLLVGGDFTRWGLANAVTRLAHDVPSYDRAVELERVGGQVIELEPSAWRLLSRTEAKN